MVRAFFRPWQRRTNLWRDRTNLRIGAERLRGVIRRLDPGGIGIFWTRSLVVVAPSPTDAQVMWNHFRHCPDVCKTLMDLMLHSMFDPIPYVVIGCVATFVVGIIAGLRL